MKTSKIIIGILVFILLIALLRHVQVMQPTASTSTSTSTVVVKKQIGGCSGTRFGCCPNGVTSKINYIGSNCR